MEPSAHLAPPGAPGERAQAWRAVVTTGHVRGKGGEVVNRSLRAVVAVAVALALVGVAGCARKSGPPAGEQQPPGPSPVELVVWSHLTPPEIEVVDKLAQEWAAQTGNKVTVLQDTSGFQEFATAARSGAGPDIMFGLPHDNLGTFWKAGLLDPVPDGLLDKSAYVPVAVDAVSFEGRMFAIPLNVEAIVLFYRTDKLSAPPTDWASFIAAARQHGFGYDVKNFYFSFPFISGFGGYVFKDTGGGLDPSDIGLANEGAVRGWTLLRDFVSGHYKFMPKDIDYQTANKLFQDGTTALLINGPWEVQGFKSAGVPFKVAMLPTLENGAQPRPFVGVYSAFVSAESKNKDLAWELAKYLHEQGALPLVGAGNRIPSLLSLQNAPEVQGNEILSVVAASAATGIPMPNIPEIQAVWPINDQTLLLVDGQQEPSAWAKAQVEAIKQRIAGMQ